MPKNPHPSGRPIRPVEKKSRMIWWNYPAETYATPRLRPKVQQTVDAIGYKTSEPSGYGAECVLQVVGRYQAQVGFIHFTKVK